MAKGRGETKMKSEGKTPQVAPTTSEENKEYLDHFKLNDGNHKRCTNCKDVIRITDNYCPYCGLNSEKKPYFVYSDEYKERRKDLYISLFILIFATIAMVLTLSKL